MDAEHLSRRLERVAAHVPLGARLADIGSDHAYLPAQLLIRGQIAFAVAGEVTRGPYTNIVREVAHCGLAGLLVPRLADGLKAIHTDDQIDVVTIAGMGGGLITEILNADFAILKPIKRLVFQPNVDAARLRRWLANHGYRISDEEILQEAGHIYEIMVAEPASELVAYSQRELLFGPYLLKQRGRVFKTKWEQEAARYQLALQQIMKAKRKPMERWTAYQTQLAMIREVLDHD